MPGSVKLAPSTIVLVAVFLAAFVAICVGSPTVQAVGFGVAVLALIVLGNGAFAGRRIVHERDERPPRQ